MRVFRSLARRFSRSQEGQDAAEYALLIGLIAVVIVIALTTFGQSLLAAFNSFAALP